MNNKCKVYVSNTESFYNEENELRENWKDLSEKVFEFDNNWKLQSELDTLSEQYQHGVIEGFNSNGPTTCSYLNLKEGDD